MSSNNPEKDMQKVMTKIKEPLNKKEHLNVLSNNNPEMVIEKYKDIKQRQNEIVNEIDKISDVSVEIVRQSFFIKDIKKVEEIPGWIRCSYSDVVAAVKHDNIIIISNIKGEIFPLTANTNKKLSKVRTYLQKLIDEKYVEIRDVSKLESLFIQTEDVVKIKNIFKGSTNSIETNQEQDNEDFSNRDYDSSCVE